MKNIDKTKDFFETYLLKYYNSIGLLSEPIMLQEEDSKVFLAIRRGINFDSISASDLSDYQSSLVFYESIGLLNFDEMTQTYTIDPSKLAIKSNEYFRYTELLDDLKIKRM